MTAWKKAADETPPIDTPVKVRFHAHGILGGEINEDIFFFDGEDWYGQAYDKEDTPCVWPIEWRLLTEEEK